MTNASNVIPFPVRSSAMAPKLRLVDPYELREEIYRYEMNRREQVSAQAYEMAIADIAGSGLEERICTVLLALVKRASDEGPQNHAPAPFTKWMATHLTDLSPRQFTANLKQIRGQTFAGLGVRPEPYEHFAGWLREFIQDGTELWRSRHYG